MRRLLFALFPVGVIAFSCTAGEDTSGPKESTSSGGPAAGGGGASGTGGTHGQGAGTTGSGGAIKDAGADVSDGAVFDCVVGGIPGTCLDVDECDTMEDYASTSGFCPGPAEIQCCTPYGLALCDPEVLRYPNDGHTTEANGKGGCPDGMVPVEDFCVDRYEASLVRVSDDSSWSPYINPGATPVRAVSVKGAIPQGYINGDEADEACLNAGKRLCTDLEWLRACQGPDETTYPYGDDKILGLCNDHRDVHPAVQYFGTTDAWIYSEIDNACLNQLPEGLDAAGANPGCVTAEGVFDMMGNLHEWTSNPAGTFRGGFYVDTVLNMPGCLYATTAHDTLHWDYSTGFRCCADP